MGIELKSLPFSESELKSYLSTKRTLVVSTQQGTSKALRKLAMQFGTKVDLTLTTATFAEAQKELLASPTHLLIADLFIEKQLGLDLITIQESLFLNRLDVSSIMMCGEPSSDSLGMMAEANVDAVLVKPFHFENFKTALMQALLNKVKPSEYWKTLEKGKTHFKKEEWDLATPLFETAKTLDPKPTLCFYYQGEIFTKKKQFKEALACLEEGLKFDPKDYRCLNAIFNTKMQASEYEAAYEVAKRIHKDYPVSTNRILDLVKVSIYTKRFEDVVDYYEIFKKIEQRNPVLSRVVIAGMLICVKHFQLKENREKALEILQNAGKIARETETLRVEVLRYFVSAGFAQEGEQYLLTLPEEVRAQPPYRIVAIELLHALEQWSTAVQVGSQLLQEGIRSERVYEIVIEGSKKLGRSESVLFVLTSEAKLYFPDSF